MEHDIPQALRLFAQGDFSRLADGFSSAGFAVNLPAPGILQVRAMSRILCRPRILLSVGVHGDETAPIEMAENLLAGLAAKPATLAVDLMVVIGHPAAIAIGKRYLEADLNRMFTSAARPTCLEAARASVIMQATAGFFSGSGAGKWHFDLHSAIRPSHYTAFAVVPGAVTPAHKQGLVACLGAAGVDAVVFNNKRASTFSAYTAECWGAASATVELGRVGVLGANDAHEFDRTRSVLDNFFRSGRPASGETLPHLFEVAQEVVKRTDAFRMACDRNLKNFTALPPHTLIAEDEDVLYQVGSETEYVVFPNPNVRLGLRAGLMVRRIG